MKIEDQVPIWDAINEYANSCGADQSVISDRRMDAVSKVNQAIEGYLKKEINDFIEASYEWSIARDRLREENERLKLRIEVLLPPAEKYNGYRVRAEQAEAALYLTREGILKAATWCANAVHLESSGFDGPPEPATAHDHELAQIAGWLQDITASILPALPSPEVTKRIGKEEAP